MSIKAKMIWGFSLVLLVFALSSGLVFFQFINVQHDVNELSNNWVPSVEIISKIDNDMLNYSRYMYAFTLAADGKAMDDAEAKMNEKVNDFDKHRQIYEPLISSAEEKATYAQFLEKWKSYQQSIPQIKTYLRNNDKVNADKTIFLARDNFNQADQLMQKLVEINVQGAHDSALSSDGTVKLTKTLLTTSIIVSILLGGTIATLITLSIIRPLAILEKKLMILVEKGGDLTQTIDVHSKDEIQNLAAAVNAFLANLRGIIVHVLHSSGQLAASSEELNASAEQSALASEQVAISIVEVAQGAEKQATASGEAVAVIEQMSAGVEQVAASANHVASVAVKTSQAAKAGSNAIEKVVNQMEYIKRSVDTVNTSVMTLNGRSLEVGEIVSVISGIAAQTNLLALNAAIEAARAGEAGRGFAVVADEVRKLAEQSQASTKRISNLIGLIRSDTEQATSAMTAGIKEVTIGNHVVSEAGQAFGNIVQLVNEFSSEISDISATIQELASGSQQIVASVHTIESISKNTASQSQTVSAATEEQSASIEEIASASQNLAHLAQELEDTIKKFKV
jgi:methyl-accepting chemotaxis protein